MEIIYDGTPKNYIFECPECGCVFVADSSEVDGHKSVMGITYPWKWCPCCGQMDVSGNEVTDEELEDIKKGNMHNE